MNFFKIFKEKAFLPVIHVRKDSYRRTVENVKIARGEGADGVFLISHDSNFGDNDLLIYHMLLKDGFLNEEQGDFWIGVNLLGICSACPAKIFDYLESNVDGLWIDSIDVGPSETDVDANAKEILLSRAKTKWDGILFGGVAFKYQPFVPPEELPRVSRRAMKYVDVVTTSGDGTGQAPDPQKIMAMKQAIGDSPLAIASGITPENIRDYLPWADAFLVATGIGKSFTELDPALVRKLRKAIDEG
jgi:hypothetical protein